MKPPIYLLHFDIIIFLPNTNQIGVISTQQSKLIYQPKVQRDSTDSSKCVPLHRNVNVPWNYFWTILYQFRSFCVLFYFILCHARSMSFTSLLHYLIRKRSQSGERAWLKSGKLKLGWRSQSLRRTSHLHGLGKTKHTKQCPSASLCIESVIIACFCQTSGISPSLFFYFSVLFWTLQVKFFTMSYYSFAKVQMIILLVAN